MTDLLTEQAAIKARRQTTRDTSGQFIRPDKALEIRVAGERMKARLEREVDALDHAEGRVRVRGYWRSIRQIEVAPKPLKHSPAQTLLHLEAA